jgi:hypothetical protein
MGNIPPLVQYGPYLITGPTEPALAEGAVFREGVTVLDRDLAKKKGEWSGTLSQDTPTRSGMSAEQLF